MRAELGELEIELENVEEQFPGFKELNFCVNQDNCRYVYFIDKFFAKDAAKGVWQFDPMSQEKNFLIPAAGFATDKLNFQQILWANENYLILGTDLYSRDSDEDVHGFQVHFLEIKNGLLKCLSSISYDFNETTMVSVLSKKMMVLFGDPVKDSIVLWAIKNDGSTLSKINIKAEKESSDLCTLSSSGDFGKRSVSSIILSTLKFVEEQAVIATCNYPHKIIRWNIVNGQLHKSWEFLEKKMYAYRVSPFQQCTMSVHSDLIILLDQEENNTIIPVNIENGKLMDKIPIPPEIKCKVSILRRISEDRILLAGGGDSFSMGIYNIRTQECTHLFPLQIFTFGHPKKFIILSPTLFLSYDDDKILLWRAGENRSLSYHTNVFQSLEAPLPFIVSLKNGDFFVVNNSLTQLLAKKYSSRREISQVEQALTIRIKNFSDPIKINILERAYGAIVLARLVAQRKLVRDVAIRILSFILSGHETKEQLKNIGPYSGELFSCFQQVVSIQYIRIPAKKITLESMNDEAEKARKIRHPICETSQRKPSGKITSKSSKDFSIFCTQGDRDYQQDRAFHTEINCIEYAPETIGQALFNTGIDVGVEALTTNYMGGSTGTFCFVQENKLFLSQLGDSSAFLITFENENFNTQRLTSIHTALAEKERIEKAGGQICFKENDFRIGNLAVSRSFGDSQMYDDVRLPGFTFEPSISYSKFNPNAENYLLLCSDGVTDELDIETIALILFTHRTSSDLTEMNKLMHAWACLNGGDDNKTSILVKLNPSDKKGHLFGVCDGHRDSDTAIEVSEHFPEVFQKNLLKEPTNFSGVSIRISNRFNKLFNCREKILVPNDDNQIKPDFEKKVTESEKQLKI